MLCQIKSICRNELDKLMELMNSGHPVDIQAVVGMLPAAASTVLFTALLCWMV